jgi:uncharacterized protein involved in exopolysaccharide biosynthesis
MNKNRFFGICAIVSGLVLCFAGIRLVLKPAEYEAAVKIEINPQYPPGSLVPYDPYFIETEFGMMKGDIVLSNVVEDLNLDTEFGKQYADGRKIGISETIKMLRSRIYIVSIRNTRLVEIRVRDENPNEAAAMANGVAQAYRDYRQDLYYREMEQGIEKLEGQYQEEGTNIAQMEANLQHLAKDSNLTNFDLPDSILKSKYLTYYQTRTELSDQESLHRHLEKIIGEDRVAPASPFITVVAPAVPPRNPVGPNWRVVVVCLVFGLVITGCGFYSL